jgi:hypothetical protein
MIEFLRIPRGIRNFIWNLESKWYSFSCPHHKGVQGSIGIASLILKLGTKWRLVANLTLQLLYSFEKESPYTLNRRLGGPQSQPGHSGEQKTIFFLLEIALPGSSSL